MGSKHYSNIYFIYITLLHRGWSGGIDAFIGSRTAIRSRELSPIVIVAKAHCITVAIGYCLWLVMFPRSDQNREARTSVEGS